jgi:hypothetical protein
VAVHLVVCGNARGSVRALRDMYMAVRLVVYGSARGSALCSASQCGWQVVAVLCGCAAVRQCATVCGSVWQCERLCAAASAAVYVQWCLAVRTVLVCAQFAQ